MRSLLRTSTGSGLVVMVTLSFIMTAELGPELHRNLLQEDGPIEWATFFVFGFASLLAALGFSRERGRSLSRLALVGLGLFCVFVAGEEISWGQRLLGFKPPEIFLEHNYQQESNLHNFLKRFLDTRWIVLFIAAAYGVVAPLLARRWRWLAPLAPSAGLIPGFAIVAVLEGTYPFELAGELAELLLGFCFLADIAARSGFEKTWHAPLLQLGGLTLGLVGAPLIEGALAGDETTQVATCREELERLATDFAPPSKRTDKLRAARRVHKRLFTAVRARYLRLGPDSAFLGTGISAAESELKTARRDRQGFLLDPWNQPYWALHAKNTAGERRLLVYSFGPNRRRDSSLALRAGEELESALGGDDLGVLIDLK